jgi:hypothetical protein
MEIESRPRHEPVVEAVHVDEPLEHARSEPPGQAPRK